MPQPDQTVDVPPAKFLEQLHQQFQPDLASEVAALRREIYALRDALGVPASSILVTGREAVDEFKRLQSRAAAPHASNR